MYYSTSFPCGHYGGFKSYISVRTALVHDKTSKLADGTFIYLFLCLAACLVLPSFGPGG